MTEDKHINKTDDSELARTKTKIVKEKKGPAALAAHGFWRKNKNKILGKKF